MHWRRGLVPAGRTARPPEISKDTPGTELIYAFCSSFDRGDLVSDSTPPRTRRILKELRNRLILTVGPDYVATDDALKIKREAGAPKKTKLHIELAIAVFDLMNSQPRVGKDIAIARVASSKPTSVSESVIRHAYDAHRAKDARFREIVPAQAPDIPPRK